MSCPLRLTTPLLDKPIYNKIYIVIGLCKYVFFFTENATIDVFFNNNVLKTKWATITHIIICVLGHKWPFAL